MRIRHEKYDDWRLFRTMLVAATAGWLACVGVTGWAWLKVEADDDRGLLLRTLGVATGVLGAAVVMYYPWELRWPAVKAALSVRPPGAATPSEPRPSGSGGSPDKGSATGASDRPGG